MMLVFDQLYRKLLNRSTLPESNPTGKCISFVYYLRLLCSFTLSRCKQISAAIRVLDFSGTSANGSRSMSWVENADIEEK